MLISDVRVVEQKRGVELQATLRCETEWVCGGRPFRLWYRFPHEWAPFLSADRGDPFVAACLAPAMVLGEALEIDAPVSPQLLYATEDIQAILRVWNVDLVKPELHEIVLTAPRRDLASVTGRPARNASFFSLGVDSSHSLLKNIERHPCDAATLTHLITVIGFDLCLRGRATFPRVRRNVGEVAEALGKQHVVVWTNLREFSDRVADWPYLYHGAASASIGLALGEAFGRIHIAGTAPYRRLYPFGSHPMLDHLWSTETLLFVHDGAEATRMEKVRRIAQSPLILDRLRVCVGERGPEVYNCGRCWKCLMTKVALYVVGALERCPTLPHEIDPEQLRNSAVVNEDCYWEWQEVMSELGASPLDERIKAVLLEAGAGLS